MPLSQNGQMVIEAAAFAGPGMLILRRWAGSGTRMLVGVLIAWNTFHVATFYAWLLVFDHWTWSHTLGVATSMLALGVAVSSHKLLMSAVAPAFMRDSR